MKPLPKTDETLVLRTDFSDDAAWSAICAAIRKPSGRRYPVLPVTGYVACVSDPAYEGLKVEQLLTLVRKEEYRYAIYLVDAVALTDPEQPILVVDVRQEPGRTFRVVPRELYHLESWFYNMDFQEVAALADADGVFRMFTP